MPLVYRISMDADYVSRARQVTNTPDGGAPTKPGSARWLQWGTRAALAALLVFLVERRDWAGVALVSVGLAGSFATAFLKRRSSQRARQRALLSTGVLLISMDDDGLSAANDNRQDMLPWSEFMDATDYPDGVLLSLASRAGYWLPDAALSNATPYQARVLIASHLSPAIAPPA